MLVFAVVFDSEDQAQSACVLTEQQSALKLFWNNNNFSSLIYPT